MRRGEWFRHTTTGDLSLLRIWKALGEGNGAYCKYEAKYKYIQQDVEKWLDKAEYDDELLMKLLISLFISLTNWPLRSISKAAGRNRTWSKEQMLYLGWPTEM